MSLQVGDSVEIRITHSTKPALASEMTAVVHCADQIVSVGAMAMGRFIDEHGVPRSEFGQLRTEVIGVWRRCGDSDSLRVKVPLDHALVQHRHGATLFE